MKISTRKRYVALVRCRPGTREAENELVRDTASVYVPPPSKIDEHWIAEAIGLEAARQLAHSLGGKTMPLPVRHACSARRDEWLRYRTALKTSAAELGRECGITERAVRLAVKRAMSRGPFRPELFQDPIPAEIFHGVPGTMQVVFARQLGASWRLIEEWFQISEAEARECVNRNYLRRQAERMRLNL